MDLKSLLQKLIELQTLQRDNKQDYLEDYVGPCLSTYYLKLTADFFTLSVAKGTRTQGLL